MSFIILALTVSLGIYTFFVIFFITGIKKIPQYSDDLRNNWPSVAVIVAARNEENNLPLLIDDLVRLDYPADKIEIMLVDDRSTDATWFIIQNAVNCHPNIKGLKIEKLDNMTPKKNALTKGILATNGEIILSTDADCQVPALWVKSMVEAMERSGSGLVIGSSNIAAEHRTFFHQFQLLDFLALVSANAGASGWGLNWSGTGQNIGYKRTEFFSVNGFEPVKDRVSGDDLYLVQAIGKNSGSVFNRDFRSFVRTRPVATLFQFLNQRIRWASNARFAATTNPFFTFFLANAFVINATILIALFIPSLHAILPMVWGIKFLGDALVIYCGSSILHVSFPALIFMIWALVQPVFITAVGVAGLMGRFTWKP